MVGHWVLELRVELWTVNARVIVKEEDGCVGLKLKGGLDWMVSLANQLPGGRRNVRDA